MRLDDIKDGKKKAGDPSDGGPDQLPSLDCSSREVLKMMVAGYYNALSLLLFPYIHTKDSFMNCKGQAFKTQLLTFLIEIAPAYDARVQPALQLLGLKCTPVLYLVDPSKLNCIVDWYVVLVIVITLFYAVY